MFVILKLMTQSTMLFRMFSIDEQKTSSCGTRPTFWTENRGHMRTMAICYCFKVVAFMIFTVHPVHYRRVVLGPLLAGQMRDKSHCTRTLPNPFVNCAMQFCSAVNTLSFGQTNAYQKRLIVALSPASLN